MWKCNIGHYLKKLLPVPRQGRTRCVRIWGQMGASWQHLVVMMLLTGTLANIVTTNTILWLHLQNTENDSTCLEAFLSRFLKLPSVNYIWCFKVIFDRFHRMWAHTQIQNACFVSVSKPQQSWERYRLQFHWWRQGMQSGAETPGSDRDLGP